MADPSEPENDGEWLQWFAALHDSDKKKVIKAVTGQSNEFTIEDMKITHFPHRFFNESRGLTKLYMLNCTPLAALPESLGQLQALTTLVLEGCSSLAALPESLGQLHTLTKLDLYHCNSLAALPEFLGQLQALTTLDLGGCTSLAALPESLGQLQALTTLDLGGCTSLAALPESFGQLQALTKLDLYECSSLAALPESLGQLQALTALDLGYCSSLAALPEFLGQLQALTGLLLFNCSALAALPESLGQLQALTTLYLYGCSSLEDESKDLARRLEQCNKKIRDGPTKSPERFHMTTYAFAATILFGSSSRYGAADGPPRHRQRAASNDKCILSKINELGEDGGASDFKKNMADFCGVSFKGAFEGWAHELREKFGLVRGDEDSS